MSGIRPYTTELYGSPKSVFPRISSGSHNHSPSESQWKCYSANRKILRDLEEEAQFLKDEKICITNGLDFIKSKTTAAECEIDKLRKKNEDQRTTIVFKNKQLQEFEQKLAKLATENESLKLSVKESEKRMERLRTMAINEIDTDLNVFHFQQTDRDRRLITTHLIPNTSQSRQYRKQSSDIAFDANECQHCRVYRNIILCLNAESNNLARQQPIDVLPDSRNWEHCRNYRNEMSYYKAGVSNLKERLQHTSKSEDEDSHLEKMSRLTSAYKDLTKTCQHQEELLRTLQNETRQLQAEICRLNSDIDKYQNDTEKLNNQAARLKKEKLVLEEQIKLQHTAKSKDEESQLQKISSLTSTNKDLTKTCQHQEELLRTLQNETRQLQAEIGRLNSDIDKYQNDTEKLNNQAARLKKEKLVLEEQIKLQHTAKSKDEESQLQKISSLTSTNKDLTKTCQHQEELLRTLQNETRQLQAEIGRLNSDIDKYQNDTEKLNNQATRLKEENLVLLQHTAKSKDEESQLQKISSLTSTNKDLTKTCQHQEELLRTLQNETRQLQAEIGRLNSDIDKYQNDTEKLNNQATRLKEEKLVLEEQIKLQHTAKSKDEESQLQKISSLTSTNKDLTKTCQHQEELLRTLQNETRQLQAEIGRLNSDIDKYQNDTEKLNNQATRLKEEKLVLEERIKLQHTAKSKDEESQLQKISSLTSTNKDLTKTCQHQEELLRTLQNETRQLQAEIGRLNSDIDKYQNDTEKLNNQATRLKEEKLVLEEQIKLQHTSKSKHEESQLEKTSKLTSTNKDLTKTCQHQEELLKKLQNETSQFQAEIARLKSDIANYQNDTEKLNNQATQLKTEKLVLEEQIRLQQTSKSKDEESQLQKISSLLSVNKDLTKKCKNQEEILEKLQNDTRQLQAKITRLTSDIVNNQNEKEKLNSQAIQLRKEKYILEEQIRHHLSDVLSATENCQNCRKHKNDISDLKAEVNKLRDRLSEAAGNKLRDGNPNIADLSDRHRPTSLAEQFSSLYTDEYTDAMEVIEGSMDEQSSASFMLELLKSCYDWSLSLAEEQRRLLSDESFGFMKKYLEQASYFQLSKSCLIYVKEFQKKIASDGDNLRAVEMICLEKGLKQSNIKSNQNMKKYVTKCSHLCWMMQISDPPIYLNFDVKHGEQLDKNVYNIFTESGSKIKFLVWPAMYMYRTGPILVKGIVQGK